MTNVALLLGGDSSERAISWKTARSMFGAVSPEKFNITVFDVTAQDISPNSSLNNEVGDEQIALQSWWNELGERAQKTHWRNLAQTLRAHQIDVVLPALHGGWGEDGTLQSLLEVEGIAYVGSPPRASVIAMDKNLGKAVARDLGIAVARGQIALNRESTPEFSGKCVVKPNGGGSSVGITILENTQDEAAWRTALDNAMSDGSAALVEEFIGGTEITAAVVGTGENAQALPLVEIVPQSAWYDFQSKYAAGGSQHLVPPRLDEEVQKRVAQDALRFYRELGCRGVARSDWIVTPEGVPYFLEINTLPGMTQTSLVPDAARAAGISFESLIERLIHDALQ